MVLRIEFLYMSVSKLFVFFKTVVYNYLVLEYFPVIVHTHCTHCPVRGNSTRLVSTAIKNILVYVGLYYCNYRNKDWKTFSHISSEDFLSSRVELVSTKVLKHALVLFCT